MRSRRRRRRPRARRRPRDAGARGRGAPVRPPPPSQPNPTQRTLHSSSNRAHTKGSGSYRATRGSLGAASGKRATRHPQGCAREGAQSAQSEGSGAESAARDDAPPRHVVYSPLMRTYSYDRSQPHATPGGSPDGQWVRRAGREGEGCGAGGREAAGAEHRLQQRTRAGPRAAPGAPSALRTLAGALADADVDVDGAVDRGRVLKVLGRGLWGR
jgi:hypothetical protein